MIEEKAIAIVSGGMDSVTLLHNMFEVFSDVHVLSFDYGQRHVKELEMARYWTALFGLQHDVIDLTSITHMLSSSALMSSSRESIPEGHYAAENMKSTVVPNRNMMMLSIATAVAVSEKAVAVGIGIHGGDHDIYPDCRPEFISYFQETALRGNEGFINSGFYMYTPYINVRKEDIVAEGQKLGVDWSQTWSCYKGKELHCGACGTCTERIEAFQLAGVNDPTQYDCDQPILKTARRSGLGFPEVRNM